MNRRQALKNIGLTTGFVIASPALFNFLQSCTTEEAKWIPKFMSQDQAMVIRNLVDTFIPKTEDSPSASEVNTVEFIDTYWNEVSTVKYQAKVKVAMDSVISGLKSSYNEDLSKLTSENYMAYLDANMVNPKDEDPDPPGVNNSFELTEDDRPIKLSKFLDGVKWMTINAFLNSEQVGENVLAYDPVPGQYICDDLQTLTGGKKYSL